MGLFTRWPRGNSSISIETNSFNTLLLRRCVFCGEKKDVWVSLCEKMGCVILLEVVCTRRTKAIAAAAAMRRSNAPRTPKTTPRAIHSVHSEVPVVLPVEEVVVLLTLSTPPVVVPVVVVGGGGVVVRWQVTLQLSGGREGPVR